MLTFIRQVMYPWTHGNDPCSQRPCRWHRDIAFIRDLIERYHDEHRTSLSRRICLAWNWVQPNGQPKDMVCRGLLLHLEQHGLIKLPPKRRRTGGWHIARNAPQLIEVDQTPIETNLKGLYPIMLRQVRRIQFEQLYNGLIAQFHYLGYAQPVGSHLKYIAFSQEHGALSRQNTQSSSREFLVMFERRI